MKQIIVPTMLCMIGCAALAAETTVSIPVTTAHERLVVAIWAGDIKISPAPEDVVRIVADCEARDREPPADDQMVRHLRSSVTLPDIVSGDEIITIRTHEDSPECTVTLTAPARLNLHARITRAGSINVDGWRGRLLAWSASGDVTVENQSSSLSVTAMDGDASVSLAEAGIDADSAIAAANGTLTLTVDAANVPALRAHARWGDVRTDLDLAFDEIMEGGSSWFVTRADDGQPTMTLRNLNHDIVIRASGP